MNENIKILFVGDSSYDMYVKAYYMAAINMNNIKADLLDFGNLNTNISSKKLLLRIERHYKIGYHVKKINNMLLEYIKKNSVDIIFLYACDIITANTVKKLSSKTFVCMYNNDDPFTKFAPKYRWRHIVNSIKYADIVYSYRNNNIDDYKKNGAKIVKLMRSYYIKERNYYIPDEDIDINVPDVCFIGHYENDERMEYINELLVNDIKVGVPRDWEKLNIRNKNLIFIDNTHKKYNEVLNKTKIAIVFLSKINNDTYTRRCFEIPVVKTLMVAPRNTDIASMFEDGREAVLFSSKKEFYEKIKYYLSNEEERISIAVNGYHKVISEGYEVKDRINTVIEDWKFYT